MKQTLLNNIKNIYGWKTKRKIIVFSVDDYGNVRLDSKKARENLDRAGLKIYSRFDAYDTLETNEDLEILYEALTSIKDKNNNPAIFTPFAMPCNINFEDILKDNSKKYIYELLPETYKKLEVLQPKAYHHTWKLWEEGIDKGLMKPQFHGREHLNVKVFEEKLKENDEEIIANLENRSYTSISDTRYQTINYTAAFDFYDEIENSFLKGIIKDGLNKFEEVFGYRAMHFMPPTSMIHPMHYKQLKETGIDLIDINLVHNQHMGFGKYKKTFNYTGKKTTFDQTYMVRNVVFEPTENKSSIAVALNQIEAAFRWNRPAVISSHRVNFCGHIDPKNRETGINALKELLKKIVQKWPDVEFMSSMELGELIGKD